MPMQQLECPNCGSTSLKGSLLIETNVVVTNTILANPKSGVMRVKRGAHEYSGETGVALICSQCDVESHLNPLVTPINYDVAKK